MNNHKRFVQSLPFLIGRILLVQFLIADDDRILVFDINYGKFVVSMDLFQSVRR